MKLNSKHPKIQELKYFENQKTFIIKYLGTDYETK